MNPEFSPIIFSSLLSPVCAAVPRRVFHLKVQAAAVCGPRWCVPSSACVSACLRFMSCVTHMCFFFSWPFACERVLESAHTHTLVHTLTPSLLNYFTRSLLDAHSPHLFTHSHNRLLQTKVRWLLWSGHGSPLRQNCPIPSIDLVMAWRSKLAAPILPSTRTHKHTHKHTHAYTYTHIRIHIRMHAYTALRCCANLALPRIAWIFFAQPLFLAFNASLVCACVPFSPLCVSLNPNKRHWHPTQFDFMFSLCCGCGTHTHTRTHAHRPLPFFPSSSMRARRVCVCVMCVMFNGGCRCKLPHRASTGGGWWW